MTNAYILISDMHLFYKNFRNRVDYKGEIEEIKVKIECTAQMYKDRGYNVILLFLGDIFHNSYNDVFSAVQDNNWFHKLRALGYQLFSVVGNHELSYYKSNPFYTLLNNIESVNLRNHFSGTWKLRGNSNILRVVDELQDGEVTFYFNHHSTPIIPPTADISIGLFHQEYIPSQVLNDMENVFDRSLYAGYDNLEHTSIINTYDYCFFGHMHQAYGIYETESGTTLCYLGSLGRTNIAEVNDNCLERNLPCVLVSDGKFQGIESNKITLRDYKSSVVQKVVEANADAYELQKKRQEIKSADVFHNDVVGAVGEILKDDIYALEIFEQLRKENALPHLRRFEEELNNV